MGFAERLGEVEQRIRRACDLAGRARGEVRLVAVSKTRSREEVLEAHREGLREFGESRVQEAARKLGGELPEGLRLHLVGHLQRNKARAAAALFDAIHSIDSVDLLLRLEAAATRSVEALCQVDLAGEATKHGLSPEHLGELLEASRGLKRLRLVGLMCLPPYFEDPEGARPYFRRLRELRDRHGGRERFPELSMGMSHDLEVAISEGATLVRVGEALFGPRREVA